MVGMARTNIDIDERLIAKVMEIYQLPTKRAAVDFALHELVGNPMTKEEILAMRGTGWEGDLEAMRAGKPLPTLNDVA